MHPLVNIVAMATFAAALSSRALDPVLPHVAADFGVTIATAAGLAAGFAFTFAIVQPVLGAAADLLGKARLMVIGLVLLAIANLIGSLATSYELLFCSRIVGGVASGGIFPIAMGLVSDLVEPRNRQVALGRSLAGAMTGNLLGASASGMIGDLVGWRGVLLTLSIIVLIASLAVGFGFRNAPRRAAQAFNLRQLANGYRAIFANRNAPVCYSAVFIEGCVILGLFPYVAAFLFDLGEVRLSIAGLVIAGFAVGGLFYTLSVSRFLPVLGVRGMMIAGASMAALMLAIVAFGPSWPVQFALFLMMGWGFYMIHGSLQVFSSELSVEARATALALHSFSFFMGQAVGPLAYGFALSHAGKLPTLLAAAAIFALLGVMCARLLRTSPPADTAAMIE